MNDTLDIGGAELISSKRASELSGYAQDYIGQLARKGLINGKRIGGLWYVSLESLNAYKSHADTYKPQPPQATPVKNDAESIISFDGRDYVSANRASRLTGYHQDYVGQLARGGKIMSRQIGNRWYVDRDQIMEHKREKDALLGAVQSQAVGVQLSQEEKKVPYQHSPEPFFTYRSEGRDLMPKPNNDQKIAQKVLYENYDAEVQPIAIKRFKAELDAEETESKGYPRERTHKYAHAPKGAGRFRKFLPSIVIAIVITVGFAALFAKKDSVMGYIGGITANKVDENSFPMNILERFTDTIERLFGEEVTYTR